MTMSINTVIAAVRLLSVGMASAMVGMAVIIFYGIRKRDVYVPLSFKHLAIISLSIAGPMLTAVVQQLQRVMNSEPWDWWASPVLFVSGCFGTYGMLRLAQYISHEGQ